MGSEANMKLKILSVLILLLSAVAFADNGPASDTSGNAPGMAPNFTERDITNTATISLIKSRGKVVMLNFWGPWCPPCRAEVPALEKLQDIYRGKLLIIGAAVFSTEASVQQFYKDYKMNYPVIWGSFDLMEKYGKISAFPTTVVINKKGEIVSTVVGSRTKDQYEDMVKPLLSE
jgi:thiol-disulfide isomerase/thioredoxin